MDMIQSSELHNKIDDYLNSQKPGLLFISFNNADDIAIIIREASSCDKKIFLSEFCNDDRGPNIDSFANCINANSDKKLLVQGIGEYLALTGDRTPLNYLWDIHIQARRKKIIVPIWNGSEILNEFFQKYSIDAARESLLELASPKKFWRCKNYNLPDTKVDCQGFKNILGILEKGYEKELKVKTGFPLKLEWATNISNYYQLYLEEHPDSKIQAAMLSDSQWEEVVRQDTVRDESFFGSSNFVNLLENGTENPYLSRVIQTTESYSSFKDKFITHFLEIPSTDPEFGKIANGRAELWHHLDTDERRYFVLKSRSRTGAEALPYLTDSNYEEKFEIIRIVTNYPEVNIQDKYPYLGYYARTCSFENMNLPEEVSHDISDYFNAYKKAKLRNEITEFLLEKCSFHAEKKTIFKLPSRGSILEKLNDGKNQLFWLDSLGCEFLSFIAALAAENGLKMKVHVGRAEVPSITGKNRGFYEDWSGDKHQNKELDKIKHDKYENFHFEDNLKYPTYLAFELDEIQKVVCEIAKILKSNRTPKVVLTSDHGASRLAVISKKQIKWEMPERGQYNGRFCETTEKSTFVLPNMIEDEASQFLCLADYSMIKGGRSASIEVHGGATLEEVIIPIIEFVRRYDTPKITWLTPLEYRPKFRDKSITIRIGISMSLETPMAYVGGNFYPMKQSSSPDELEAEIPIDAMGNKNRITIFDDQTEIFTSDWITIHKGTRNLMSDDDF